MPKGMQAFCRTRGVDAMINQPSASGWAPWRPQRLNLLGSSHSRVVQSPCHCLCSSVCMHIDSGRPQQHDESSHSNRADAHASDVYCLPTQHEQKVIRRLVACNHMQPYATICIRRLGYGCAVFYGLRLRLQDLGPVVAFVIRCPLISNSSAVTRIVVVQGRCCEHVCVAEMLMYTDTRTHTSAARQCRLRLAS